MRSEPVSSTLGTSPQRLKVTLPSPARLTNRHEAQMRPARSWKTLRSLEDEGISSLQAASAEQPLLPQSITLPCPREAGNGWDLRRPSGDRPMSTSHGAACAPGGARDFGALVSVISKVRRKGSRPNHA